MQRNLSNLERGLSIAVGVASVLPAFRGAKNARIALKVASALVATGLVGRGLSGRCPLLKALGRDKLPSNGDEAHPKSLLVNKRLADVRAALDDEVLDSLSLSSAPDGRRTRIRPRADADLKFEDLVGLKAQIET